MLTIIGDVHQNFDKYLTKVKKAEDCTLQLGDMGFYYSPVVDLDPQKHKFFGGNHDNYDIIDLVPNCLGDFGVRTLGGVRFFFVRGAYSVDLPSLVLNRKLVPESPKLWWYQEQLTFSDMLQAYQDYMTEKPSIMITHTAPTEVADAIGNPDFLKSMGYDSTIETHTQSLFSKMFADYQPDLWIFGHFHRSWEKHLNGTHFICLPILGTMTLQGEEGSQ